MLMFDSVKHLDLDFVEGQTNKPTTKTLTHVAYNSFLYIIVLSNLSAMRIYPKGVQKQHKRRVRVDQKKTSLPTTLWWVGYVPETRVFWLGKFLSANFCHIWNEYKAKNENRDNLFHRFLGLICFCNRKSNLCVTETPVNKVTYNELLDFKKCKWKKNLQKKRSWFL